MRIQLLGGLSQSEREVGLCLCKINVVKLTQLFNGSGSQKKTRPNTATSSMIPILMISVLPTYLLTEARVESWMAGLLSTFPAFNSTYR